MRVTAVALACTASQLCISTAPYAQTLPKRPIRMLVGATPGGPSDAHARLVAPRMSEALGQTIIVDNRASNNGVVANEIAARATPDGSTLIVGNSGTHAVNQTLYRKLAYDCVRDFAPITQFSTTGLLVATHPRTPAGTVPELTAHARREPGRVNIGIPGSTGQLAGDALWAALGIRMNNVNYKGSSPAEIALLSGEVDIVFLTPLAAMHHLASGRLKALGITSIERHPALAHVPTVAEQGVPGYDFQYWNGLFAPAATPPRLVRTLHEAALAALRSEDVKERLTQLGLVVKGTTPQAFADVVKDDVERYRRVILEQRIERL